MKKKDQIDKLMDKRFANHMENSIETKLNLIVGKAMLTDASSDDTLRMAKALKYVSTQLQIIHSDHARCPESENYVMSVMDNLREILYD